MRNRSTKTQPLPDWEQVLSAAAHLQRIVPEAVLVGGTAAAVHARHRLSRDADHVVRDLRQRFDDVLAQIESVAGWRTARVARPVMILGSLDGIETGVRQLIREAPLETTTLATKDGEALTVPTAGEILRVKGVLILRRNATRDYLDFAALADRLGDEAAAALETFDTLYPQESGESSLQQLQAQLAKAMPYDLDDTDLAEYKALAPRWQEWAAVEAVCARVATAIFDHVCAKGGGRRSQRDDRSKQNRKPASP